MATGRRPLVSPEADLRDGWEYAGIGPEGQESNANKDFGRVGCLLAVARCLQGREGVVLLFPESIRAPFSGGIAMRKSAISLAMTSLPTGEGCTLSEK